MIFKLLITFTFVVFLAPQVYAQHDLSDDARSHYAQGHEFYKQGKYDDAISEFKRAVEHDPTDAASLFGLGNSYFLKGDFNRAISHYQEVAKIKPDFPKAHYALALAYRRVGKNEEAEKEFKLYTQLSAQKPAEKATEAPKATAAPKPAEAPKPTTKRLETKVEGTPTRPTVKKPERETPTEVRPTPTGERPRVSRIEEGKAEGITEAREAAKRKLPEEVLKRARPTERKETVGAERPLVKKATPPVRVAKKPPQAEGNFVYRSVYSLWNSSPMGKLFVALVAYTLMAQVWIGIVVLIGLAILWRKH